MNIVKKFIFIGLLILQSLHVIKANDWQNIGCPRGLAPTRLYMDSNDRVFSGSYYHGLFYSDDFGQTWTQAQFDSDEEFLRVEEVAYNGSDRHYASTNTGIFVSDDNGDTWIQVYEAYWNSRYHIIDTLNDSTVFCWNSEEILRSTDEGTTWDRIWDQDVTGNIIRALTILDGQEIYIADNNAQVLVSQDQGSNWSIVDLPTFDEDFQFFTEIEFSLSNSVLYLYTYPYGYMFEVSLANNSYSLIHEGWGDWILNISNDGEVLYNSSDSLFIFNTIDNTLTFLSAEEQFGNVFREHSNAIRLSDTTILLSNTSYDLFLSVDGGYNWEAVHEGFPYRIPLSIEYNEGRLIVGVHQSYFGGFSYYTDNLGEDWIKTNMSGKALTIGTLYEDELIAGGPGGVYLSHDNGETWEKNDSIGLVYSLFVASNGYIFVGNNYDGVFRSTDNGQSWHAVNNGYSNNYSFGFGQITSGRLFSGGWPTDTYYTDNYGSSWHQLDVYPFTFYRSYSFCGADQTIVSGLSSGIATSHDGGESWEMVHYSPGNVRDVLLAPTGDYFALSEDEGVLRSEDNGMTWSLFNDGLESLQVFDLLFDSNNIMYLTTASGIYVNKDFLNTDISITYPENVELLQPYPNPFNNGVNIAFRINSPTIVMLDLFDLTGKHIETILNNELVQLPVYNATWTPNGLSTGIYFLTLQTDHVSLTKKLLYVK